MEFNFISDCRSILIFYNNTVYITTQAAQVFFYNIDILYIEQVEIFHHIHCVEIEIKHFFP